MIAIWPSNPRIFTAAVGAILCCTYATLCAGFAVNARRHVQADALQQRISSVIHNTIEKSKVKLSSKESALVMPILPSDEDVRELKRHEKQAIAILASYATSAPALEQHVSLRILVQFSDHATLPAIEDFAERSLFGGIRQEAISALNGFPPNEVRPILERLTKSDPDPAVRAHARRALASATQ